MSMRQLLAVTASLLVVSSVSASAQSARAVPGAVKLSDVLRTFLADSGVQTRGLAWTTGNTLPIKWESPGPQPQRDAYARSQGLVLSRTGSFMAILGDSVKLATTITVGGIQAGLARVALFIPSMEVTNAGGGGFFMTREMVEAALRNDGLTLQPLKCKREVEGASYGNLVDAVKAPGKTASGLWWFWQSPQQQMELALTILYRRADMAAVECQSPEL